MTATPHFLEPWLTSRDARTALVNLRSGRSLASRLELAGDSASRTRGLLGRSGLADDAVLIIAPCSSVHTFFMRFTIDVVFVDRDGRVVKVCRRLRPWRLAAAWRAFAVLEFAAGTADRLDLVPGDRLGFEPR